MNKILEGIYVFFPTILNNLMISGFNLKAYNERYLGNYKKYRKYFKANEQLRLVDLEIIQFQKLMDLLNYSVEKSIFYKSLYQNVDLNSFKSIEDLQRLPIVDKELLRSHIHEVYTISKKKAFLSKTGGTTGKSLEVLFTLDNLKERFSLLDNFRAKYGYELGKRTAWFSGKNLLTKRDLEKNRFWKTDYLFDVRYYSTFHIKEENLKHYVYDLIKFRPEFISGFPSSISEIAKYGLKQKIEFPPNVVRAVFTTAETVTTEIRNSIVDFFKTDLYDQYASSEGAPFIFECKNHNLHLELQSGVFEVLNENNEPANEGKLVVTSFTSYGTPLIRYNIGDNIRLSENICSCGNENPLVESILGRTHDFIYSNETGKINLGNISNCLKGVSGVIKFQIIQNEIKEIVVKVITDNEVFTKDDEKEFLKNLHDRIGNSMKISISYVNEIENEKSGKFRLVKNNLKNIYDMV